MSNDQFKRDFAAILNRAGDKARDVVVMAALGTGGAMVEKSPVDTGRFKGNWQYGIDDINTAINSPPDTSGGAVMTRIRAGLDTFKIGQTIYISNSLPYSQRLENGWSKQAPSGMVRLSVLEFRQRIEKAARAIRNV